MMPFQIEDMMIETLNEARGGDILVSHFELNGSVSNGIAATGRAIVITSYSIHYTKLYEVLKALGKKKVEVLKPFESQFLKGVVDNGGTEEVANELWGYMLSASLYLFNLSHSAAYAITGYIGQWLKVHYLV